jgi:hypothetical protein
VLWAETAAGANLALNPTPDPDRGVYVVVAGLALRLLELVDRDLEDHVDDPRYLPHPATCPRWHRRDSGPASPPATRSTSATPARGGRELVRRSACPHCSRPVIWAATRRGRNIPLNPTPDPRGQLIPLRGRAYEPAELRALGEPWSDWADALGHLPHPVTCPSWPRPEPARRRGGAQGYLACWVCGVIDHTVRHTGAGDRCSTCRTAVGGAP